MLKKINSCFLVIFIFSVIFIACDSDNIGGSGTNNFNFSIPIYDYSDSHYLVDTLYRRSFLDYYNNTTGVLTQHTYDNRILSNDVSFEVWLQCEVTEINKRFAVGHLLLYEEPTGGYSDTLLNTSQIPGIRFFGYFRELHTSEYYISEYAGMIGFRINIPENYHAGIVYKTQNGNKYGKGSNDVGPQDTLILKMFKTFDQSPDLTPLAWVLKLKNIYRLPINNVIQNPFDLNIYFYENGVLEPIPPGSGLTKRLTEVLGLDRYQPDSRTPPPDGLFDFLPGYTIIPETGDIIFPTFRPFYDELWYAGADSVYWFPELYEQRKSVAQNTPLATKYRIYGYGVSGD